MKRNVFSKGLLLTLLAILFAVMAVVPACDNDSESDATTEGTTTAETTTIPRESTTNEVTTTEEVTTEVETTTEEVTTEPVTTKAETTRPETTKPETTKPETTKPETTKPETTKPETTVPETTVPETTEAPVTEPPVVGPEIPEIPTDPAEIDALIASIQSGTAENEDKIDLAYLAYHQLSAGQKAQVKNYETLCELMTELTKNYVVKEYRDTRIPHHEFLLGTWRAYNYDDEHLQEMVDCYIDFVVDPDTSEASLDQHAKYGIGMIPLVRYLGMPYYSGGDRLEDVSPAPEFDADAFLADSQNVVNHPALWGSYPIDEPNANDFEYINKVGQLIENEILPGTAAFHCLFPNLASQPQLGRSDYATYVKDFVETVDTDVIYYDHYPYNSGDSGNFSAFFRNLNTMANYCYELGRDHWIVLQVNTAENKNYVVSADMMRFQAYASMAYGAKSITWACWFPGWWENNIYTADSVRTEQYEKLQETNADLKALEPIYMRYTGNSNAILCGVDGALDASRNLVKYIESKGVEKMTHSALTDLTPADPDFVLVGHYEKNVGEGEAYMFVNCNDFWFKSENVATVTFKAADPASLVTAYVKGIPTILMPDENGVYTVEIHGADAVFVTVD